TASASTRSSPAPWRPSRCRRKAPACDRGAAMTAAIFARTLTSAAMAEVFADRSIVAAMLAFEAALAEAEAAEGVIPTSAIAPIVAPSRGGIGGIDLLVGGARRAGSLAIPLVKRLTAAVAERDAPAAAFVHH